MGSNTYEIKVGVSTSGEGEVEKLGRDMEKLGKISSFKTLGGQIAEANQKVIDAQVKVDALAVKMANAKKPSERLSTQYANATAQLEKMTAAQVASVAAFKSAGVALEGMGVDIKKLDGEQERLRAGAQRLKEVIAARGLLGVRPYRDIKEDVEKLTAAYKRLEVEHKNGTISSKELYKAQMQLREKTKELEESSNGWAKSIVGVKTGLLGLAAAGYGAVRGFASYGEFAQQMAKVNTMIDVTRERHKELSDAIVDISRRVPESAKGLGEAEYDILSSGVALEQSTAVLEQAARAAVAGVTDTKTAAASGVGVVNAYGMEIGQLGYVYDVMFQTIKDGVVDFPQLSQHMGDVLPTARAAGVGFEEVSAAISAMTINGMKAPKAFTALNGAIVALSAPAPEAKRKFDELGITWKGLVPTLDAIRKKNLDIAQMRELIPDVEARNGVLNLTQGMNQLTASLEGMNNAAGQTDIAYDKMKDTPQNQAAMLRNEFSALAMVLEEDLMKGILPAMKGLKAVAGSVSQVDDVTKTLIETVVVSVAGLAAWRAGMATVAFGLKGLGIQLGSMTGAMSFADIKTKGLTVSIQSLGFAQKAAFAASAVGAAYGIVEIGKLVIEVVKWAKALSEASDAMDRLEDNAQKTLEKNKVYLSVEVPKDLTGKSRAELEKLDHDVRHKMVALVAKQNQHYAESEKNASGEYVAYHKKQYTEVGKQLQELKKDYQKLREAQGLVTKTEKQVTPEARTPGGAATADTKKADEARRRLAGQLENELTKIEGDGFESRRKQAESHYQKQMAMAHGSKDLMAKSAQVRDAALAKINKDQRDAEQKAASAADESRFDRLKNDSDFSLAMLEDTYDDGKIALEAYFSERMKILEEQYQAEYNLLSRLASVESDPTRKSALENQIKDLQNNHALTVARLGREKKAAQEGVAAARKEAESVIADLRVRSGEDKTSQDQQELAAMDQSHAEELQRIRDSYKDKAGLQNELHEKLNQAEISQNLEKNNLIADQEKRAHELRLSAASSMAGNLSTIFSNLYELTGKKHKEFFYLQKAAAIAEATINAYLAASKALTTLPPPLSYAAAGIAVAMGMTQVAMITAQQPGYATGGPVHGSSPSDSADNIPAWLTAGEYVHPVAAVRYYGPGVMAAMRQRRIPREMFAGFEQIERMNATMNFASGGPVQRIQREESPQNVQAVTITNIIDPRLFEQYAASSEGQKTIMNVISRNSFQVKRILSR